MSSIERVLVLYLVFYISLFSLFYTITRLPNSIKSKREVIIGVINIYLDIDY